MVLIVYNLRLRVCAYRGSTKCCKLQHFPSGYRYELRVSNAHTRKHTPAQSHWTAKRSLDTLLPFAAAAAAAVCWAPQLPHSAKPPTIQLGTLNPCKAAYRTTGNRHNDDNDGNNDDVAYDKWHRTASAQ